MTITAKRIHQATAVTAGDSWYDHHLLIDKSGNNAALKLPVADVMGNVHNVKARGASPLASATTNTDAILETVAEASAETYPATVILPAGRYAVHPDQIKLDTSHITLQGTDSYRSQLYCASPGTVLTIEKNSGADIVYDVNLRDIAIYGDNVATVGIAINNLSELVWRNVAIYNCSSGMTIRGQYCGNYHFHDFLVANCSSVGVSYIANGSYAALHHIFDGGNFYNCPTMVKFCPGSSAYHLKFTNINFELFSAAFLFVESTTAPIVAGLEIISNYFQTYSGSGTATRILKLTAADTAAAIQATNIRLENNQIATNDCRYVVEADLNSYHPSTVITMWLRNNLWIASSDTAWVKSDVTSPLHHVVCMDSNQNITNKPDQDGMEAQILGVGTPNIGYQFLNEIKGPLGYGTPIVLTPNSISPSIRQGTLFETANTSATDYYGFNDGTVGQRITVLVKDANTSFDFTGSNLIGNSGSNFAAASGDWLDAVFDGSKWRCSVHDCTA